RSAPRGRPGGAGRRPVRPPPASPGTTRPPPAPGSCPAGSCLTGSCSASLPRQALVVADGGGTLSALFERKGQPRPPRSVHAITTPGLHLEAARRQVAVACAQPTPVAAHHGEGGIRSRPFAQHHEG